VGMVYKLGERKREMAAKATHSRPIDGVSSNFDPCPDPGFQSLLELAVACDVPVKWSCRTGVCHTCECALIGGVVDYLLDPLEPPAEGNALICCSQPRSDVEIDL
jgi:ferredoxin